MKPKYFKTKGEKWEMLDANYAISNQGRVYSFRRKKLLKATKNSSGYYRVKITKDALIFIHIKVVEYFGDCNGNHLPKNCKSIFELGKSIDHVDANKRHNQISNLELVTHSENIKRMWARKANYGTLDKVPR